MKLVSGNLGHLLRNCTDEEYVLYRIVNFEEFSSEKNMQTRYLYQSFKSMFVCY